MAMIVVQHCDHLQAELDVSMDSRATNMLDSASTWSDERRLLTNDAHKTRNMASNFVRWTPSDAFDGKARWRIPQALWRGVQRKLKLLDAAARLDDLLVPAGNRLEALKGDRSGRHISRVPALSPVLPTCLPTH